MQTIKERADRAIYKPADRHPVKLYEAVAFARGYEIGATEQKAIDIDSACNIFCYTGCPHKTDSYNCLNNKCDTWKIFRRMMEE